MAMYHSEKMMDPWWVVVAFLDNEAVLPMGELQTQKEPHMDTRAKGNPIGSNTKPPSEPRRARNHFWATAFARQRAGCK